MKFPRNAKILRSQFDVAPFAAVFFLLVIFLLLAALLPVPGVQLQLTPPDAAQLSGTDQPVIAVAVDSQGRFYFENQIVSTEAELITDLAAAAKNISTRPTLLIHADKAITYEQLLRLTLLARQAGILNAQLATLPRLNSSPDHNE